MIKKGPHKNFSIIISAALFCAAFLLPTLSFAQSTDASSLTITPPFFELDVNPGDSWSSSIRVINTNLSDMQVHAELMGFGASDAQGHGSFTPLSQLTGDSDALANWITVSTSSTNVPRDGAIDMPFSVVVPRDASPGGHYAAILIGTGAPSTQGQGSAVGVSSYISALIFVRVSGDVNESAEVQEFSTDHSYYQTPDVHFALQIKNDGNVHVRPVGTIQIYNAFGKERGEVSINKSDTLGYVLPSSTREFDIEWQGSPSLLDIGPYTAVVTISYGENGKKSISRTISFWILPVDQLLEVLLGVLIVALLFVFIVKRLVRKMLANEISKLGGEPLHEDKKISKKITAKENAKEEVLDLRNRKKK